MIQPATATAIPAALPKTPPPRLSSAARLLWPWAAALLSGLLLVLCLEPWNQQWLCWLALTPLLTALWFGQHPNDTALPTTLRADGPDGPLTPAPLPRGRHWWRRILWGPRVVLRAPAARGFFLGYVTGLVAYWGAFYWLWEVTPPGWFILAFYMALYCALFGAFVGTVARPTTLPGQASLFLRSRWNLWFAFLAAAAWTVQEWLRGWVFSGFGWNGLGIGLHANLPLIQIAEWTGVGGVSFVAAFANVIAVATVYRFILEVRTHRVRAHFDFTLTIAGLLAVFAFGLHRVQTIDREGARPGASIPLRVAAIQPDVPRVERLDQALIDKFFTTYGRLTDTALAARPQLLLWPEGATLFGLFADRPTHDFLKHFSEQAPDTNLLIGTQDYDFGEDGRMQNDYNAAALLPAHGGDAEIYRKIHLVPFGEYIPFRKSFPLFAWIIGDQVPGDFEAGTEPGLFHLRAPDLVATPLICFEDTLGRVVRAPVLQGAQLLVNLTNDVWFGRTAQPEQHLAEAVFRTVENRRPMVRCANTGATAFVDTTGRVTNVLRSPENGTVFTTGILFGEVKVPAHPALTFYTRHGEVFSGACALVVAVATLLWVLRQRRVIAPAEAAAR